MIMIRFASFHLKTTSSEDQCFKTRDGNRVQELLRAGSGQSVPSGSKAVSPAILSYFINGILNHIFFLTVADVCGFHAF